MKKFEDECKKTMVCGDCGEQLIKVNEMRMGPKRTGFYSISGGFYYINKKKVCVGCYKQK